MNKTINPVLQDWVMTLNWKEQTGLISAIRGLDGCDIDKELDRSCKKITRMIRFLVLNNADTRTGFMSDSVMEINKVVDILNTINDQVIQGLISLHWFDHIFMAIKIIIDKHPNPYIRIYWHTVYDKYNTSGAVNVEKVILKEVEESNLTMDDIKNIVSEIDNNEIGYPAPTVEEVDYPTIDDKKPIVLNPDIKLEPVEESENILKQIKREFLIHRSIRDNKVKYDFSSIPKETVNLYNSLFVNLDKLDILLTNNWNMRVDLMSAEYHLSSPIHRGPMASISKHDSRKNTFLVDFDTDKLIYVDDTLTHWVISSTLDDDILTIQMTNDYKNGRGCLVEFNDKKMNKGDVVENVYIHGEIRVKD